jgi:hypothetical protein
MTSQRFSGRIRQADYDRNARQLTLSFDNGTALAYQQVPEEVFRRLCSSPNPATYWEDRIAEEYPKKPARAASGPATGAPKWSDLFGGDDPG